MSLRYSFRNNAGFYVDLDQQIERMELAVTTNAEEGTVGTSSLPVRDTEATFAIRGHRGFVVWEDAIPDAMKVIWSGYTAGRTVDRDPERVEDARTFEVQLVDLNSVLERRIMTSDSAERPAESDVARITWLLGTSEASLIDDDRYVSLVDPEAMDATDYRKQRLRDVIDDCAQQSGKNWFLTWVPTAGGSNTDLEFSLFYDFAAGSNFSSDIRISNDLADVDSLTTFAPAYATRLQRDPSRVFSGIVVDYDGGWEYVTRDDTATDFALGGRDTTMSAPNVKTRATAIRRGRRWLTDIATEEDTISTAIVVDGARINRVMAGHRMQVKFTHFDEYTDFTWVRVLERTIREIGPDVYELALEVTSPSTGTIGTGGGGDVYGILLQSHGPFADGLIRWEHPGGPPYALTGATTGLISEISDSEQRPYTGWLIEGTGTVNVAFYASCVGVFNGTVTVTWAIQKNGVTVASEVQTDSYSLDGVTLQQEVTVSSLAVSPNDVIRGIVTVSGQAWFFTIPAGVGDVVERLEITGGSLS